MTAPRQVLAGASYLVTRRCLQRQFLLRPCKTTDDTFLFLLAVAARRCGIQVHAYCVLSNHYHLVLTDPFARLPEFHRYLDALVARAVNASLGRWETFWAPASYSAVRLMTPADIVDKVAYVLANPVAAGLVRSARTWPGLWSNPESFGSSVSVPRPQQFFAEDGALPKTATLVLSPPPAFESAAAFKEQVVVALRERERRERRRHRRGFLGVARVLATSPFARPASMEPRRNLSPRIAAKDKWKRIEALAAAAEFVRAYRAAWARRRAGDLDAPFPPGTYLMRVLHGVPCAGYA